MKINKIFFGMAVAAIATSAMAQEQLHHEIVLDKDFVPVVKKATRKSTLPQVVKPGKQGAGTSAKLSTSDWAQPTQVSTGIPTMLPYGYRTGHNFSEQRGYIDLGAGTQANLVGSVGYRIASSPTLQVDAWWQHSSSWVGKNSSQLIADSLRQKQKWNDNVLGLDLLNQTEWGKLALGAKFHFDSFNYYGGTGSWWDDNKQLFVDVTLRGKWDGEFELNDHRVDYHAGLAYNFGGYNNSFTPTYDGANEHVVNFDLGARYAIEANSGADSIWCELFAPHPVVSDNGGTG